MRKFNIILAVALLGISITGCQKEKSNLPRFTATIEQCMDRDTSKMTYDGTTLRWKADTWNCGDMIGFNASNWNNWWIGAYAVPNADDPNTVWFDYSEFAGAEEVASAVPPFHAWFPAEINDAGTELRCNLPGQQRDFSPSNFAMPMYAITNNTEFHFRNLCGLLKIHLPATSCTINRIILQTDTPINGQFSINGTASEPTLNYVCNGSKSTVMYHTTPDDCSSGMNFYMYLPAGTYSTVTLTFIQPNGDYCIKSGNNIVVQRSKYSTINIGSLNFTTPSVNVTNGRLPGLFTINSNGDQVRFSQGNLQYKASDNVWRFGLNQYDFVGSGYFGTVYDGSVRSNNQQASATYTGWVDLFGWGTSGWDNGNAYYRPYDTEPGGNLNEEVNYGYGPTDGSAVYSLTGAYANADWGIYNPISNGGNQAGLWRTLTYDEMYYIVNSRPSASSKCLPASVSGIPGMILLPDNWTALAGFDITDNVYNPSQWTQLETAGAVFLPMAGSANGTRENPCECTDAIYWTSTCNFEYFTPNIGAFFMTTMGPLYRATPEWYSVQYGFFLGGTAGCVRLVQDAE